LKLGLHESHFVNPNGLHNPGHVSSARDMAMIARALLREFPERAGLFNIGALQLNSQIIRNHNGLLGRYPGADGMKTGFTCPAGFNVVASANHYGRHLIAVVLGAPSARLRNQEAADLFDRGFATGGSWAGFATGGSWAALDSLPSAESGAPNVRANVCLHRGAAAIAAEEDDGGGEQEVIHSGGRGGAVTVVVASGAPTHTVLTDERPQFDPVPVFVGPVAGWNGPVLGPRPTATASALPGEARAYAGEKPDAIGNATAPGEPNAPRALEGAVRTPSAEGKHHAKSTKHVAAAKEPDKTAVKPKTRAGKTAEALAAQPVTPPPKPAAAQ
jgi:D-alanyl-D-alanine carboxypeptidase